MIVPGPGCRTLSLGGEEVERNPLSLLLVLEGFDQNQQIDRVDPIHAVEIR